MAPSALKSIGVAAFLDCKFLHTVELNRKLKSIGWLCFFGTGVNTLAIPKRLEKSQQDLGIGLANVKELVLPDGLTFVGGGWFRNHAYQSVVIPRSVWRIDRSAFADRGSRPQLVVEAGSPLIGSDALASYSVQIKQRDIDSPEEGTTGKRAGKRHR